eukprot:SAG31_NODE_253_length_19063_cov_31.913362_6_plen_156_part_00
MVPHIGQIEISNTIGATEVHIVCTSTVVQILKGPARALADAKACHVNYSCCLVVAAVRNTEKDASVPSAWEAQLVNESRRSSSGSAAQRHWFAGPAMGPLVHREGHRPAGAARHLNLVSGGKPAGGQRSVIPQLREQFKINFKLFGDFGDFDLSH